MHKVAVYGSLRKGMGNHVLLKHVDTHRSGIINGYEMYSCGGFPAIVQSDHGYVKVEVYEVDDKTLQRLDALEGYTGGYNGFYDRAEERVVYEDGEVDDVLVYYMHNPPSDIQVESGDWVEFRTS